MVAMPATDIRLIRSLTFLRRRQKFNVVDSGVLVSLIGGGFGLVGILLNKIIKENRSDHGIVRDSLNRIETKIDGHLEDHK